MRKYLLLGLTVATLCITGCEASRGGAEVIQTETQTETQTEIQTETQTEPESTSEEMKPAQKEFLGILGEIDNVVEVGTAGSSLKAAIGATYLLNWAVGTTLTTDEIAELTSEYIGGLTDVSETTEKMKAVDYTYKELLKPGMEELLLDAGVSDIAAYPWSENGEENINIEAVMKAFGLR